MSACRALGSLLTIVNAERQSNEALESQPKAFLKLRGVNAPDEMRQPANTIGGDEVRVAQHCGLRVLNRTPIRSGGRSVDFFLQLMGSTPIFLSECGHD